MTRAQAAEGMAEAHMEGARVLAGKILWPNRAPLFEARGYHEGMEQHDLALKIAAFAAIAVRAALAAYEASAEQGTAWRREAPTAKDAVEVSRWWWVRYVSPSGFEHWRAVEDFGDIGVVNRFALLPVTYPGGGWHEFRPCRDDAAAPLPAAQVVEAARSLADALDAFDAMAERDGGASGEEQERLDRAIIDAQYRVSDAVRALTAGTPGKETE